MIQICKNPSVPLLKKGFLEPGPLYLGAYEKDFVSCEGILVKHILLFSHVVLVRTTSSYKDMNEGIDHVTFSRVLLAFWLLEASS